MTKNLEQIRAHNALTAAQNPNPNSRLRAEYVKKIPAMISQNGLLGAMAFALEKGDDYTNIFSAVLMHLSSNEIRLNLGNRPGAVQNFLLDLAGEPATVLRAITTETLAYLNYLRRFVSREE
ncbi:MAG TPA: type III-B CRISPR module-associated protein Cmr5 [Lentisphaeria bacterium]|nr:MAG: CRISPR-associated protein (Cas_Cmr5) [Lentisphaerae bacterium ADurb.Bin082]HPY90074.1 type III-B CRISPR module-associated protein Cmr5 [Lentisphaeria bacterium]HQC52454.1 type III-B CRISPR module-associated protein Cmr5 [Lentisphaeria bacterium]HQL87669.1 type III-B CRISPR module-associated protein Cmr5 [Lentisphaeria bacterium]